MFKEAILIDGKARAYEVMEHLRQDIHGYEQKHGKIPCLEIILVGDDPASRLYVNNKIRAAHKIGIMTNDRLQHFPVDVSERDLLKCIERMNEDKNVSGIIVQLPLPPHISREKVIKVISPHKDVDGFHPYNVGLLHSGYGGGFVPCTARGCLDLIKMTQDDRNGALAGKNVVIIGRSNIVGRPLAALLSHHDATVTLCHSKTANLAEITSRADIVVSAVGKPQFLTAECFSESAIVIDVGINRILSPDGKYKLVGDVDFEAVRRKVAYITPVPGGVGPMTIAYLLTNTFEAMARQL